MKAVFNKIFQATAMATQVFNLHGDVLPPNYQKNTAIGIAVAQGVVGVLAHYYTPSGEKIKSDEK
jgi:hypothetical protein